MNVVLLCRGGRYGARMPRSGLSPTYEDYREAQGHKPILAFVQADVQPALVPAMQSAI